MIEDATTAPKVAQTTIIVPLLLVPLFLVSLRAVPIVMVSEPSVTAVPKSVSGGGATTETSRHRKQSKPAAVSTSCGVIQVCSSSQASSDTAQNTSRSFPPSF